MKKIFNKVSTFITPSFFVLGMIAIAIFSFPQTSSAFTDGEVTINRTSCNSVQINLNGSAQAVRDYGPRAQINTNPEGAWLQVWVFGPSGQSYSAQYQGVSTVRTYNNLPGGAYTFQIHYFGNNMFAGADEQVFGNANGPDFEANCLPVVNAGVDQNIGSATSTSITGTATDQDGYIFSKQWSQVSGPATASIASPTSFTTGISGMSAGGTYVFRLTANDDQLQSAFDDMSVVKVAAPTMYTVTPSPGANGAMTPSSPVSVASGGTTSFDVIPNSSSYMISSVSGCNGTTYTNPSNLLSSYTYNTGAITSNCTVSATFSAAPSGSMSGTLLPVTNTCTIASGASSCTSPTLTWTTTNPVATSAVTNNGTATPSNATGNNNSSTFTVPYNNAMSGVTTFYLYNNAQLLASATVTTSCIGGSNWNGSTCAASGGNLPPDVVMGTPPAITLPTSSASISASATDPDGTIASTLWTFNYACMGCSTPAISSPGTLTTTVTNMTVAGDYHFIFTATDNLGASAQGNIIVTVYPPSGGGQPDLTASDVIAPSVGAGTPVTFNTNISNIGAGNTGAGFSNKFQVASAFGGGGSITNLTASSSVALAPGDTVGAGSSSYSFPANGNYSVRACADSNNVIIESNDLNNCGNWTNVTIGAAVTATLGASPTTVSWLGGNTTLTWNSSGMASCTASNTAGNGSWTGSKALSGSQSVFVNFPTTFQLDCTTVSGTTISPTVYVQTGSGPDLTASQVSQSTATIGSSTSFSATVINSGTSSTQFTFPHFFQSSAGPAGTGLVSDLGSINAGYVLASGESYTANYSHTYTTAPGTYSVRFCADATNSGGGGMIMELDEGNNCGGWKDITLSCPGGTAWGGSSCVANAVPTVTTPTVSSITTTGATLGANVTSLGSPASISARGTCWGTTAAPVTNCTAEGGTSTGVFTQARTGMAASTTYFYRGYATNATGTGYSADGTFTTINATVAPTVTTSSPSGVASSSANGGGTIVSNGGSTVTVSGIAWSTSINPTTALSTKTTDGWAVGGPWTSVMTGLAPSTLYHVRAYATNSVGTSYGSDLTFTTTAAASPSGTISVTGCSIALSASTCNASVTWTTANLTAATTEVTRNNPDFTHVSWLTSGTNFTNAVTFGSTGFFLYHNSLPLAASNVIDVACASGSWNGTTCASSPSMSGTITPGPVAACAIAMGSSSCTISLTWTTTNPVATSAITSTTGTPTPGNSANNGTQTFTAPYNPSGVPFFLYNNAVLLYQTNVVSDCVTGSNWQTNRCVANVPTTPSVTLTPSPASIKSGASSTLTWTSANADSCTGTNFNTGGATSGSVSVSPTTTTTYTITCFNNASATQFSVDTSVTVGSTTGKKPGFKEN